MIVLMIILYMANIVINRQLHYTLYKMDKNFETNGFLITLWFIPALTTIAFLVILSIEYILRHKIKIKNKSLRKFFFFEENKSPYE